MHAQVSLRALCAALRCLDAHMRRYAHPAPPSAPSAASSTALAASTSPPPPAPPSPEGPRAAAPPALAPRKLPHAAVLWVAEALKQSHSILGMQTSEDAPRHASSSPSSSSSSSAAASPDDAQWLHRVVEDLELLTYLSTRLAPSCTVPAPRPQRSTGAAAEAGGGGGDGSDDVDDALRAAVDGATAAAPRAGAEAAPWESARGAVGKASGWAAWCVAQAVAGWERGGPGAAATAAADERRRTADASELCRALLPLLRLLRNLLGNAAPEVAYPVAHAAQHLALSCAAPPGPPAGAGAPRGDGGGVVVAASVRPGASGSGSAEGVGGAAAAALLDPTLDAELCCEVLQWSGILQYVSACRACSAPNERKKEDAGRHGCGRLGHHARPSHGPCGATV